MLARLLVPTGIIFLAYVYVVSQLLWPVWGWQPWFLAAALVGPVVHFSAFALRFTGREGRGYDALSWMSYLLMGAFALTLVLSVLRDVTMAVLYAVDALYAFLPEDKTLLWQRASAVVGAASLLATAWGFFGARKTPRINRVEAAIDDLPPAFDGYTIAQLTDVHIGPTIKRPFIEALVAKTNGAMPDAICITGDLIDGSVEELAHDAAPLAELSAPDGVHYVTGNHEFYAGVDAWLDHFRILGFNVLENAHVLIERGKAHIALAGIHDYSAASAHRTLRSDMGAALAGVDADTPRILLAHQPRSVKHAKTHRVDLMLTGHTHGGQFVPWNFFVPLQQPHVAGFFEQHGTKVWVSRGAGYWGPPVRLLAESEITLMTLRRA